MIGLPSTTAVEPTAPGEASDPMKPPRWTEPGRSEPRRFAAIDAWHAIGWLTCGVASGLVVLWLIFFSPGEVGSKAEWFFGAAAFAAVAVALWQTLNIQRRARRDAAEAAERLRRELAAAHQQVAAAHQQVAAAQERLAAAQERSARELAHTQTLHRAEMDAQQELARVQHNHLLQQQQKQAMIEVSRAVSAHTQMLATLWNQGATILRIDDRDEREQAMAPIFEQIGHVVYAFSVELANAHLLVNDERLHHALDSVNEAALLAIRAAEDVHVAVVDGVAPDPNPMPGIQQLMHRRAAEARRLAWALLRTGLDDIQSPDGIVKTDRSG
jgi:hypothetical protein